MKQLVSVDTIPKLFGGFGYVSVVEGRRKDLQLQEYGLVGPRKRHLHRQPSSTLPDVPTKDSRILRRLGGCGTQYWHSTTPCIREVGIACVPVVEELIEELQAPEVIHQG